MNGETIRELRAKLDITRTTLARFLLVSEQTVSRWENDGRDNPIATLEMFVLHALHIAAEKNEPSSVKTLLEDNVSSRICVMKRIFELAGGCS